MIRFMRIGRKNQPSFKIVVTEKTKSSTGGRFVEEVGFYNPVTKEKVVKVERIRYWISQGAQPTPTVSNLLISEKVIEGQKTPKHKKAKQKQPEAGQKSGFDQNTQQEQGAEPKQKPDFNQNTAESTPEPAPEEPKPDPLTS